LDNDGDMDLITPNQSGTGMICVLWNSICDCEPGEVDETPPVNILDVVYIINYLYKNGPNPQPYEICNSDADCDCSTNILDVVFLINFLYKNGPSPCSCEQWYNSCGALK
jgi:hypothetical protein